MLGYGDSLFTDHTTSQFENDREVLAAASAAADEARVSLLREKGLRTGSNR
jgi:hypothetical protein